MVAVKLFVPTTLKRLLGIGSNEAIQVYQPEVFWHIVLHSVWMEVKLEEKRHFGSSREVSDTFEYLQIPFFFQVHSTFGEDSCQYLKEAACLRREP